MKGIFTLDKYDFIKGLVVAVFAAVVTSLAAAVNVPGFDFATFDWSQLLQSAVTAFVAYLSKNLLTTSNGTIAGAIPVED